MTDPSTKLRDELLAHIRATARYWATLPDFDPSTGNTLTVEDRCNGLAFSILTALDGCSSLPAFDLVAEVYLGPEDDDGDGPSEVVTISEMLHEHYYQKEAPRDGE